MIIRVKIDTQGWRSRDVEATRGHSSVFLDRRLDPRQETRDAGVNGIVLLIARISKPFAYDPNKDMGPFLHDCKWPTTVSLEVNHNAVNEIGLVRHLAWSFHSTPCTHNQVFVHTFGSVHSLCTVAGLDNRNHCLLQLICGGPLSLVSPT